MCACLGARLLPQPYHYPDFSEAADRVGAQLRGDKECPFSDVTKSGRVWRKVPESDVLSVRLELATILMQSSSSPPHPYIRRLDALKPPLHAVFLLPVVASIVDTAWFRRGDNSS